MSSADFVDFARTHGVDIRDLRADGRIHRCPTVEHPRSENGAYMFDGSRGWVQNWETGDDVQWWNDPHARPFTEADKQQWHRRRQDAEADKRRRQERAAIRAGAMVAGAEIGTHPYLASKGFPDEKALVDAEGGLIIPMRDWRDNALIGAQVIRLVDNEWQKRFLPGQRTKGAVLRIGPQSTQEAFFVEGYATALTVAHSLNLARLCAPVFACFSASNLTHVAGLVKTRHKFIFADNDANGTGKNATEATGLPFVMSDIEGEDANDLQQRAGIFSVVKKVMEVRRAR